MSLDSCIKSMGKALNQADATAIRALVDSGMEPLAAIDTHLNTLVTTFDQGPLKVGDFRTRTSADGTMIVYGDVAVIRESLPDGVMGTPIPGGLRFTPNVAHRVAAALKGESVTFSRAGNVVRRRKNKAGRYIGASSANDTDAKRRTWFKKFKALALEGERGRMWYEASGEAILNMTGNNIEEAKKFIALLAIYSPQAKVDANSTFALRAWSQYKAGDPITVKTASQDRQATEILYDGKAWGGEKTNNFYSNLLREVDPAHAQGQGATIDMWMMRAGFYDHDNPNDSEYAFMENETNILAQQLGWEPQHVQAAVWVAIKARMENKDVKKKTEAISLKRKWIKYKGGTRVVLDKAKHAANWVKQGFAHDVTEEDTTTAKFDFSDGVRRHMGQLSWEAIPSTFSNMLPGIHNATYEQLAELQVAMQVALSDDDGVDLIAQYLGILADGSVIVPGEWQGAVSPSSQLNVSMAPAGAGVMWSNGDTQITDREYKALKEENIQEWFEVGPRVPRAAASRMSEGPQQPDMSYQYYGATASIDPAQHKLLSMHADMLGLLLRQDSVGYHKPFYKGRVKDENGLEVKIGRELSPSEVEMISGALNKVLPDLALISTPVGIRVVKFDETVDNVDFHKIVGKALAKLKFSGVKKAEVGRFASDGNLLENNWKENSNGEDYRRRLAATGRPDFLRWGADFLYPKVQAVYEEFGEKYGWGESPPIQKFFQGSIEDAANIRRHGVVRQGNERRLEGAVDSQGRVRLVHYARTQLTITDPTQWTTGLSRFNRSERGRKYEGAPGRTYFGIESANDNPYIKEQGLGSVRHESLVDAGLLYDPGTDPEGLWKSGGQHATANELAVRDAGYIGYWVNHPQLGKTAALFEPASLSTTLAQSAWHGSPYDFSKFDLGAIGTGEGAQAYGWGLYFAQRRGIAEWYLEMLADYQPGVEEFYNWGSMSDMLLDANMGFGDPATVEDSDALFNSHISDAIEQGDISISADDMSVVDDTVAEFLHTSEVREAVTTYVDTANPEGDKASEALDVIESAFEDFSEALKAALPHLDTSDKWMIDGKVWDPFPLTPSGSTVGDVEKVYGKDYLTAVGVLNDDNQSIEDAIAQVGRSAHPDATKESIVDILLGWESDGLSFVKAKKPGGIYQVDIPDEDNLLYYDIPLIDQSAEVRYQLEKNGVELSSTNNGSEQLAELMDSINIVRDTLKPRGATGYYKSQFGKLVQSMGRVKMAIDNNDMAKMRLPISDVIATADHMLNEFYETYATDDTAHRGALFSIGTQAGKLGRLSSSRTGQDLYRDKSQELGSDRAASEWFNSIGIPGLRYRDGPSRNKRGNYTHNYVIWDDNVVSVEAINGELQAALQQEGTRASIEIRGNERQIRLGKESDRSSFIHESAHMFLELEKQLAADFGISKQSQAVLDWLEVGSFDEITVDMHEKYAETFEVYVETGNAPSLALRDAFAAFRRWMVALYKSMDPRTRADLTPEITEYFDRMLATDAEIEQAQGSPAFEELFRSQDQAGMTDAEWEKYQKQKQRAVDTATATLDSKIVGELTARATQQWKDEKQPLVDQEKERIRKEPVYQVLGNLSVEPMDYDAVVELNGGKLPGKLIGKAKKGGIDPDLYAEMHGFDSAGQMIKAIVEAPTLNKAADAAAEEIMVAKHGDILNDGSIEQEARDAMHNEEQSKLLLMELKALDKTSPINREYLKAEAKRMVAGMKFKGIKPSKFYRAEIRAAQEATAAKTDQEKFDAKAKQLANHYLFREATKVRDDMQRQRRYVNKVAKRKLNPKQVDPGYIAKIKTIANMYDMRANTERVQDMNAVISWFTTQMADENKYVDTTMLDINILEAVVLKDASPDNQVPADFELPQFDDLTAEQLQSVYDQLRHLRFVGGAVSQDSNMEKAVKRTALSESILANGRNDNKSNPGFPTRFEAGRNTFWHFFNSLVSLRNMTRKMDNEWEGSEGVAYDLIYADVEAASNKLVAMKHDMYEVYTDKLEDLSKAKLSRKNGKDYTFENGETVSIASEQRFMMAVYWGTESSREALRTAHRITDEDVAMVLADLTPTQVALVNSVWEVNETLWPELSKASTTLYGVAPPKLDATPFTINGTPMTGGHMRLFYDSSELELRNEQASNGSQSNVMPTKAGSLHSRVGSGGRPPALDISNIIVALDESMHFIAFAETGDRLHGLIDSNEVKGAIEKKFGKGFYKALIDNVDGKTANRSARETAPGLSYLARLGRKSTTMMYLAWNIKNTMEGMGVLPQAMDEAGYRKFVANAIKLYPKMLDPTNNDTEELILEKSKYMRDRGQFISREASETIKQLTSTGQIDHAWKKFQSMGFTPQIWVDKLFSYPVWLAAYDTAMEDPGMSETKAVSIADTAVSESIGSGSDLHLGGIFGSTQSQWVKLFTMMGSWFNMTFNRMYRSSGGGTKFDTGTARTVMLTPLLTAALSAIIIGRGPDEDDDEGWVEWMMWEEFKFLGASMPIVRDMATLVESGRSPGGTSVTNAAVSPIKAFKSLADMVMDDDVSLATGASRTIKAVGGFVPIPFGGNITRVLDFWDANDGPPSDPLEAYKAVTVGRDAAN